MKKLLRSLCFTPALTALGIASTYALAGQNVGSGGAIVQGTCDGTNPDLDFRELLDFWEVRYRFGYQYDLGAPELSIDEKLEIMLGRLSRLDPERSDIYRAWLERFWDEAADHQPRFPFPDLTDAGNITPNLPLGCYASKIIEQSVPENILQTKRYFVRRELFDLLDNDSKAGLLMHEIVYRDAIARGHLTSMKVRLVTGVLGSTVLETLSPEHYETFMIETGMVGYMANITPGTNYGLKRYFDHVLLGEEATEEFCNRLKGDSRIAADEDIDFRIDSSYGAQFRASAIGQRILGRDSATDMQARLYFGHVIRITSEWSSYDASSPDTLLPFFCWQQLATSPWTQ